MYDILIIGGGISGLYFLHRFKNCKNLKIGLLEKDDKLGGKCKTKYDDENNIMYETGPWRISLHHNLMINLCKELNIELNLIKKEKSIYINHGTIQNIEIPKNNDKNSGMSVYDCFLYSNNKNYADYIENKTGYNEILNMTSIIDAYDAQSKQESYFVIKNGFSHLIQKLEKTISNSTKIFLKTFVIDILKKINYYKIIVNQRIGSNKFLKKIFKAKKLIIACPPSSIKKWSVSKHFDLLFSSIQTYPLNHIYGLSNKYINNNFYIITSDNISQLISSNYNNNWIQISYSGGRIANYWERLYLNHKNNWKNELKKHVKNILNIEISELKMYYWPEAIHFWNPSFGFNLNKMYKLALIPNPIHLENLFIIGEAFSKNQGWCEGALETVEDLLKMLDENYFIDILDLSSIPFVIYKDRILNVKKWINVHPGSKEAIKNHLYEDVSILWETIHNSSNAKNQLISLQIGWKKNNLFFKI